MKIAIIGSFYTKIPLKKGLIHTPLMLTYDLAIRLSLMGHNVTYFGRVGKKARQSISRLQYRDLSYREATKQIRDLTSDVVWQNYKVIYEQSYIAEVLVQRGFDLYYTWNGLITGPLAKLTDKPVILSHHDSTSIEAYNMMFRSFNTKNIFLIPVSQYMKDVMTFPQQNVLGVVHHGIEIDASIQTDSPDDTFCWVGRIIPAKGLHNAIELVERSNKKLKIIGLMRDSFADSGNISKYCRMIQEKINRSRNIEYLGALSQFETRREIAKSKGLIFPLEGTESFALIVIEAITAGVPVIATNKKPLNEIIDHGRTGFLCDNMRDMMDAIREVDVVDRDKCREIGRKRFSLEVAAEGYERKFKKALAIARVLK